MNRRQFLKSILALGVTSMSRFGEFKYGAEQYGADLATDRLLTFGLIIAWEGGVVYSGENEAHGRMISLHVKRGRRGLVGGQHGFYPYFPGVATAIVNNSDGRYDAWDSDGPLYPNVSPGKFCRLMVRNETTGTLYPIMRGMLTDIQPFDRGGQKYTRLTIKDSLDFLSHCVSSLEMLEGESRITIIQRLYEQILKGDLASPFSPQYWEWEFGGTPDAGTIDYWWCWQKNTLEAMYEIMESEGGGALFSDRYGDLVFRPVGYAARRYQNIDVADMLRDLTIAQPWEVVRNQVKVHAYPKTVEADAATLWTLNSVPVTIADGTTFVVESNYRFGAYTNVGSAAVVVNTHECNAEAGGGGADVTGSCPLTVPSDQTTGGGAQITITNNSGATAYLISLTASGKAIYASNPAISVAVDVASIAAIGTRSLVLDSNWMEDSPTAQENADWLLGELVTPQAAPTVQLEDQPAIQFTPDLYDAVDLTIPTLGLNDVRYRLGGIEHQTIGTNCNAVRTIFRLEPYMQKT